jgi:hypothetical protein
MNLPPRGPLLKITRRIKIYPLSEFKEPSNCTRLQTCGLGLRSLRFLNGFGVSGNNSQSCSDLMTVDEVPDLFTFLLANGYTIDTRITKMMNQSSIRYKTDNSNELIALITYQPIQQSIQPKLTK